MRWALADALAMSDPVMITERVILPYLDERRAPAEEGSADEEAASQAWLARDKAMAYLIGLTRVPKPEIHQFLVEDCLRGSRNMRLWLSALSALGRWADAKDQRLMHDLARDRLDGQPLAGFLPDAADRLHVRRKALELLANFSATFLEQAEADAESFTERGLLRLLRTDNVDQVEGLTDAYYETVNKLFWSEKR